MKTYQECLAEYGSEYRVRKMLADGELHRTAHGLYSTEPYERLTAVAAVRYPNAVVSHDSAFFYHGLTDVYPDKLHLTVARDSVKIHNAGIKQHFVAAKLLEIGKTEIEYNGEKIRTYDLERLCIDLMRMRRKLPYDYYKEIVLSLRGRTHEMYPAKIDEYLDAFPHRSFIMTNIEKEIF